MCKCDVEGLVGDIRKAIKSEEALIDRITLRLVDEGKEGEMDKFYLGASTYIGDLSRAIERVFASRGVGMDGAE